MTAPADPAVLKALKEIQQVYKKYDLGGHIIVASKESVEFSLELPTWSCAFIDEETGSLRFRSIRGNRTQQEQRDEQICSAALVLGLRDILLHQSHMLVKLGALFEDKLGVESDALENMRPGKAPEPVPN